MSGAPDPDTDDIPEITAAMAAAGARVIWSSFSDVLVYGSETGRETAIAVYLAMKNQEQ